VNGELHAAYAIFSANMRAPVAPPGVAYALVMVPKAIAELDADVLGGAGGE
jgi:hypothetical protein